MLNHNFHLAMNFLTSADTSLWLKSKVNFYTYRPPPTSNKITLVLRKKIHIMENRYTLYVFRTL